MASLGFAWYYPTLMALVIFAGSLEFLIAGALVSAFHPPTSTAAGSCSSLPLSTMSTGFPAPQSAAFSATYSPSTPPGSPSQ
ncbi:hypothetical protein [Arcanobacterium haemolyticum]|uniref:hypothetical protein n=1 Tax=Arcanobacterium haemolyticum TaxID=28264 RepID=UPI0035A23F6D